jgi:Glycosyl hydrolases family 16
MGKPTFISILLSGVACTLLLSAVGSISYGPGPYGVSPPSGEHWTMTFDDEFTHDSSINTNKWNGGAGGTDWCSLNFHGKSGGAYMFREDSDPCGQHYDGCTLSSANGLEMRSPGFPSAAIQTGGTTAQNAKFIQKFGYWEARLKVPHSTDGEGRGIHSDFWLHPIPEGVRSPVEWLPEIDVGERPVWDAKLESANNKMYFGIHDYGHDYGGHYGTSPLTDLSADWHTYGLYWRDDGSGPYGSMQFYLDGSPLGSPYTLRSGDTNMASGIYMFLSLDNDKNGGSSTNPFLVQHVRVWRLDPNSRHSSSSSSSSGTRTKKGVSQ